MLLHLTSVLIFTGIEVRAGGKTGSDALPTGNSRSAVSGKPPSQADCRGELSVSITQNVMILMTETSHLRHYALHEYRYAESVCFKNPK